MQRQAGVPKEEIARPRRQDFFRYGDGGRDPKPSSDTGRVLADPGNLRCLMSTYAAAFHWIRTGGQGNGYTAASALPRACLDHEYRALHGHVAGAVQGCLALIWGALAQDINEPRRAGGLTIASDPALRCT